MGKPSRVILARRHFEPGTTGYSQEDVLEMSASWAIVYDYKLVSLRRIPWSHRQQFKYLKLIYPDRGRAMAIAGKLNEDYKTDKFRVVNLNTLVRILSDANTELPDPPANNPLKRGRGRPVGGVKKDTLIKQRIVLVEEQQRQNLGNLLDDDN